MDQIPLVEPQIDAAQAFLDRFQNRYPVEAAFWLKESDVEQWYLFVVSSQITDDKIEAAYRDVLSDADELHNPWFDPFQVKLISPGDPRAKAALRLLRNGARAPLRLSGSAFGGLGVDAVFLYPLPSASSIA